MLYYILKKEDFKMEITLTKLEAECVIQALRSAGLSVNKTVINMYEGEFTEEQVENAIESAEQKILEQW